MEFIRSWGFVLGICVFLQGCGACDSFFDGPNTRIFCDRVQIPSETDPKAFVDAKGSQASFEIEGEKECILTGCGIAKVKITEEGRSWIYRFPIDQAVRQVELSEIGGSLKGFEIASLEDRNISITGKIQWKEAGSRDGFAGGSSSDANSKQSGRMSGILRILHAGKTWRRLVIRKEMQLSSQDDL